MFRSHSHPQGACCAVQRETHAAHHTTHDHNQAHSKQRTTHTQKNYMLPQHRS